MVITVNSFQKRIERLESSAPQPDLKFDVFVTLDDDNRTVGSYYVTEGNGIPKKISEATYNRMLAQDKKRRSGERENITVAIDENSEETMRQFRRLWSHAADVGSQSNRPISR